ncbi:MAG: LytR/AlgR family response regulator transcription factor [Cyclobacteriaceae bacterium]|jgi:two-component system response regulator LytT
MKIVIVEDEKLIAKDLAQTILSIEPNAEIVKILYSVEEAIIFFQTSPKPDLIFSDIELGDGLSFKIYQVVGNHAPIIFCTAFNEYALEAFKTAGIDYLLKPFSKASVAKALEKYQKLKATFSSPPPDFQELLKLLGKNLPSKNQSVLVYQADKIIPIEEKQVALFFVENENVYAYTFDQKKLLVNEKMESLEASFSPHFFRANRQFLINRKAIKDAANSFNRKITVNLIIQFKEPILVGKLKVTEFLEWLKNH